MKAPHGAAVGFRRSVPLFLPTLAIGVAFGLVAAPMIGPVPTIVMSAVVWSGAAQFAALTTLSGGLGVAVGAGLMANGRYLPMGFAIAPSLQAPAWRRVLSGALLSDASFAIAHERRGFDIAALEGAMPVQYLGWVGGTVIGAAGTSMVADPDRLGFGAIFPVFYLGLLMPELRGSARAVVVAAVSAGVTLVLIPVTPEGVPLMAGAACALLGLRDPR